jgi:hypothetical protein
MWGPEKGRTDIAEGVDVEVDVPTRVRWLQGAMTECDSVVARCVWGCELGAGGEWPVRLYAERNLGRCVRAEFAREAL